MLRSSTPPSRCSRTDVAFRLVHGVGLELA